MVFGCQSDGFLSFVELVQVPCCPSKYGYKSKLMSSLIMSMSISFYIDINEAGRLLVAHSRNIFPRHILSIGLWYMQRGKFQRKRGRVSSPNFPFILYAAISSGTSTTSPCKM